MRNALVLVPLCIGLTSGFIVSTSTVEPSEITISDLLLKSKPVTLIEKNDNEVINMLTTSNTCLDVEHIQESDMERDLFSQTAEKENNIIERSFIFVNQRWKKQPKQSYLIDSKKQNVNNRDLQKSTVLNVYEEIPRKPLKNFVSKVSSADTKYFSSKQRHAIDKVIPDKGHFPPVQHIEERGKLKSKINNKKSHQNVHKHSNGYREYIELLKAPLLRLGAHGDVEKLSENNDDVSKKSYSNINDNKQSNHKSKMSSNNIINIEKLHDKPNNREQHDNVPLFKDKLHELADELNEEIVWDKLFQHTLEEQVPERKTVHKHNHSDPNNVKYCQECAWKANLQKLDNGMLTECRCKCGRYIHLRGRPDLKDLVDMKREVFTLKV